ncbi:MAG: FG-GAP-like repeat-containing protein [Bacteroidota bacterium]
MEKHFLTTLLYGLFCTLPATAQFRDITQSAGLPLKGYSQGIAIGDYNNDGWEDLYISVETGNNRLCKNNGDGTFSEVADDLGLAFSEKTKTAVWGDFNNDGWLDLYVANLRTADQLLLNEGNGTFENITEQAGISNVTPNPTSVNLADVNQDGFLDIYVSNFKAENILYINNGDLTFTDKTLESGTTDTGSSMGSLFFDYDGDGDQDLYLVHDNIEPNILYENDGTGHFTDVSRATRTNVRGYGMGVAVGDVNNDALPDLYITNLFKNYLLINQGNGTFFERAQPTQTDDFGMGWGTTFLDFNNDGLQDIYVSNDSYFSEFDNVLYENRGDLDGQGVRFEKVAANTQSWQAGYGIACFDHNQDGQTDLTLANYGENDYTQLFRNENTKNNYLDLFLVGTESNRQAIGATVIIETDNGQKYYQTLTAGHGWASQNSSRLHFGIPKEISITNIQISWPSGLTQTLAPLPLSSAYTVVEGEAPKVGIYPSALVTSIVESKIQRSPTISVFPNPAKDHFSVTIKTNSPNDYWLNIFNSQGQRIGEPRFMPNLTGKETILIHPLPNASSGLLFIQLRSTNHLLTKKISYEK